MLTKEEIMKWVEGLDDDEQIGIDDGGLILMTSDGQYYLEVGGI